MSQQHAVVNIYKAKEYVLACDVSWPIRNFGCDQDGGMEH
jgi:hypothetical protein